MKTVRGKAALVTGAASGIGAAIALALAREGADLYLVDIDEAGLNATARQAQRLGVTVATRRCDLAQPAEITAMVNALLSAWGKLDILVNNAGIAYYGPTGAMTPEQWNRLLAVNLLAPIQLVRELLPTLQARGDAHILNVSSIFGLVPLRKAAAYQASKYGLVGLSAALRAEYARDIGVTVLCPGFVRTGMLETFETGSAEQRRHAIPDWVCASPEAVGAAAVRAIRRNKGLVLITPMARLVWWLARLSPSLVDWLTRQGWRRRQGNEN
jgi:3-oxoacyl-[acyl-carrier protein] reductase